jgi:predicted nicotinamide N-methyase
VGKQKHVADASLTDIAAALGGASRVLSIDRPNGADQVIRLVGEER